MIRFCPRFTVPRIRIVRVPKGPRGTMASADLIANLIREGARDFYVRQKAIEIFREAGAAPKDRWAEVCALFNWVRNNIRYRRDIFRTELLHTARRMLELQAGDCDDMTILLGAMLISTGHPVRLALTGFRAMPTSAMCERCQGL
jgi:transglutaminase-like putative cysteine protease